MGDAGEGRPHRERLAQAGHQAWPPRPRRCRIVGPGESRARPEHFDLLEVEPSILATYPTLAAKHIHPLIGKQKVGALRSRVRLVLRRAAPVPRALRPAALR